MNTDGAQSVHRAQGAAALSARSFLERITAPYSVIRLANLMLDPTSDAVPVVTASCCGCDHEGPPAARPACLLRLIRDSLPATDSGPCDHFVLTHERLDMPVVPYRVARSETLSEHTGEQRCQFGLQYSFFIPYLAAASRSTVDAFNRYLHTTAQITIMSREDGGHDLAKISANG